MVFDGEVGVQLYGRSLWFTDDLFQRLRPYNVVGAPALSGALEFYPASFFTSGVPSWFGLVLGGEVTPYLSSSDAQGRSYTTTAYGFTAGVRARYTLWRAELGATLAYQHQEFSIDRGQVDQAPPEGIPSVTYQSLRMGLSARVQIVPRLAALARGSYLLTVGFGELAGEEFFPRVSGGGVEAGVGAAYVIKGGLEARIHLDWRRLFFSMNPVVGDRLVAGGGVDDYYSATLGVAYRR